MDPFTLTGADGTILRGDRVVGQDRQLLFITGFLSKRWGNKSKALAQWCQERGWGFCCFDFRGWGDSGVRGVSIVCCNGWKTPKPSRICWRMGRR